MWGKTTPGWTDRQPDAIHEYEISGIGEVKATNQPVSQTTAEGQGALYAGKIDMHIKCECRRAGVDPGTLCGEVDLLQLGAPCEAALAIRLAEYTV